VNDRYVFLRTERGTQELGLRTSALSPKHRRCLLLVDGKLTLRDLAASFRPGELGPILRDLVERGCLEAPPEGIAAIEAMAAKIAFIDDARFAEVQKQAMREIGERLGRAGDPLVMQIGACARPEQLRIALRALEKALQAQAGADYARDFVKRVGQALMGA
jgi:hypothetical protein